ncbi:hypothetical protein ATO13_23271 [Stappia sp. 22II-S9-Z10]|nr:hypothetical protein ATO13_23271 [Stappia sp. 22II-S9-Z10]
MSHSYTNDLESELDKFTASERIHGYTLAESVAMKRQRGIAISGDTGRRTLGPKRDPRVARTVSGRPSRSKRAKADRAALETEQAFLARARVFGLTPAQARLPQAGTALGRMYVRGTISLDQYLAGELIRDRAIEARRALDMKTVRQNEGRAELSTAEPPRRGADEVSESYEKWAQGALQRFDEVREVLREVCREERSTAPSKAVSAVVLDDRDTVDAAAPLRFALNGIHRRIVSGVLNEENRA